LKLSLILREEHRLSVFLNKVFEPKREEVTGFWRTLHNDEIHNFSSPYIRVIEPRRMRSADHAARMREIRMHA
jgi:hypothetical protein